MATTLLGRNPLQHGLFESPTLRQEFCLRASSFDRVILVTSRRSSLSGVVAREALVVDLVDSLALNFKQRARFDRLWWRPLWRTEARRLRRDELRLVERSRSAMLVADRDRDDLASELAPELRDRLVVVPLLLSPVAGPASIRQRGANRLLITGNLGYFPTVHGALWFLDQVWPHVQATVPGTELVLAGSRPAMRLTRRARRSGGQIHLDPPDLDAELEQASIALVPLFAGSGSPMKLLEAIATRTPVLVTPAAASGVAPEIRRSLVQAEDAEQWVQRIAETLKDYPSALRRAKETRSTALEVHSEESLRRALAAALS